MQDIYVLQEENISYLYHSGKIIMYPVLLPSDKSAREFYKHYINNVMYLTKGDISQIVQRSIAINIVRNYFITHMRNVLSRRIN